VAEIFDSYVIMTMNEGITVKPSYNKELIKIAKSFFSGKNFGYITHRKNSYSVDPSIYRETSKIENLVAFAVVSTEKIKITNVQIEKIFLKKPFQHFITLEEAVHWVREKVSSVSAM